MSAVGSAPTILPSYHQQRQIGMVKEQVASLVKNAGKKYSLGPIIFRLFADEVLEKPLSRTFDVRLPAVGIAYRGNMFDACLPFAPCVTSNDTFWPSFSDLKPDEFIAEKWANKSSPPWSGVMKPKPLASLNHFTVPVAIMFSSLFSY